MAEDAKLEEWKKKYFDALAQIENQDERVANLTSTCHLGLSRLAIAAQGAHSELDKQLSSLRSQLKASDELSEIGPIIENISEIVGDLEESRGESETKYIPALKSLLEPLNNDRIPKSTRKLFRDLKKSTEQPPSDFSLEEWLIGFSRQFRGAIEDLLGSDEPKSTGFISKLFSGDSGETAATGDIKSITTQINKSLIQLLDEIPIPASFESQMQSAQSTLSGTKDLFALPEILDQIVALLIKVSQEEAEEFTSFLKSLNERLDDIQHYLEASSKDKDHSIEERKVLDSTVREQVAEIHETISTNDDINELKSSIKSRVDVITGKMDEFWSAEDKRQQAEAERIQKLTDQLESTEQEAQKLRQALIEQQARAHKDPLTHIPNRQAYNERLAYEEARWKRYQTPLSLVVCDIDHFKRFNDDFGHLAGDKVLTTVAKVISESIRATDFVARYGGEEFVVLMPETSAKDAKVVADKLRQAVSGEKFTFREQQLSVTMSCGVAEFSQGETGEATFELADKALYVAKEEGRNRVCMA